MATVIVSMPVPFQGTDEERKANFYTHDWCPIPQEEVIECNQCATRSYHVAALYPCGVEPPRERKEIREWIGETRT